MDEDPEPEHLGSAALFAASRLREAADDLAPEHLGPAALFANREAVSVPAATAARPKKEPAKVPDQAKESEPPFRTRGQLGVTAKALDKALTAYWDRRGLRVSVAEHWGCFFTEVGADLGLGTDGQVSLTLDELQRGLRSRLLVGPSHEDLVVSGVTRADFKALFASADGSGLGRLASWEWQLKLYRLEFEAKADTGLEEAAREVCNSTDGVPTTAAMPADPPTAEPEEPLAASPVVDKDFLDTCAEELAGESPAVKAAEQPMEAVAAASAPPTPIAGESAEERLPEATEVPDTSGVKPETVDANPALRNPVEPDACARGQRQRLRGKVSVVPSQPPVSAPSQPPVSAPSQLPAPAPSQPPAPAPSQPPAPAPSPPAAPASPYLPEVTLPLPEPRRRGGAAGRRAEEAVAAAPPAAEPAPAPGGRGRGKGRDRGGAKASSSSHPAPIASKGLASRDSPAAKAAAAAAPETPETTGKRAGAASSSTAKAPKKRVMMKADEGKGHQGPAASSASSSSSSPSSAGGGGLGGHTLRPTELGRRVAVSGDGWGNGQGRYEAVITEADDMTFTVISIGDTNARWEETHVLKEHCEILIGDVGCKDGGLATIAKGKANSTETERAAKRPRGKSKAA